MPKKIKGIKNFDDYSFVSFHEFFWRSKAACRDAKTSVFFSSPKSRDIDLAKSYCKVCTVAPECLFSAMQYDYDGIWGGTTEQERDDLMEYIYKNDISNLTLDDCRSIVEEL